MDYKSKVGYDKDLSRSAARQQQQVMHPTGPTDDGYYNTQYMYPNMGDNNLTQSMNMNPNNPMMAMGMQTNTLGMGQDEQSTNYYQEYCRLFIANVVLTTQMKELVAEKNELMAKLAKLEQKQNTVNSPSVGDSASDLKKKRDRRRACEIDRHYICPIEKCQKAYGSEGSLNQHVKNKHPELANNPEFKISTLKKTHENASPKKSTEQSKSNDLIGLIRQDLSNISIEIFVVL